MLCGTVIALLLSVIAARSAQATLIISDTFTAPNSTALIGRFPAPIDTPATAYGGNGNVSAAGGITGGPPYEADIQNSTARLGADAGAAVNLNVASAQRFQLSIDFNISANTETQANNAPRGAGLGFFSSLAVASGGSSHGFNNFTGLVVDTAGSVRLIIGGTDSGIFTTVAGFNATNFHTLSYTVDTASGAGTISSILLDGSSVSLTAATNTFTVARTVYAGFYNSSGSSSTVASFDNFQVASVPEPGNYMAGLLGLGLIAGTFLRRPSGRNEEP